MAEIYTRYQKRKAGTYTPVQFENCGKAARSIEPNQEINMMGWIWN